MHLMNLFFFANVITFSRSDWCFEHLYRVNILCVLLFVQIKLLPKYCIMTIE